MNHTVENQSRVFLNTSLYEIDPLLKALLKQLSDSNFGETLKGLASTVGSKEYIKHGFLANKYLPELKRFSQKGFRIDLVEFHPSYHRLMELGKSYKVDSLPWGDVKEANTHQKRMALYYLTTQNEAGTACPLTMTFASVPVLQKHFFDAESWIKKISSGIYDGSDCPYFEKSGLTLGMAMTEKQGGSDIRANQTKAVLIDHSEKAYALTGHKWFCSAPMSDAFLVLAQAPEGLSCFLMPRYWKDGQKNDITLLRLKDKLGNKSNASSEIELNKAKAWLLGEAGKGISVIIEMVSLTRYDCMIGSTALMRRALSEVLVHVKERKVFGKTLIDQPMMRALIADLCLELTGHFYMTLSVSKALDASDQKDSKALVRILTPLGKYWITKRASWFLSEAMECLGGNGYIEENIIPRLYREAPVNAIWEGSGNIQCLDVLRILRKEKQACTVFLNTLEKQRGKIALFDRYLDQLKGSLNQPLEEKAREIIQQMVLLYQASLFIKRNKQMHAKTFVESRLGRPSHMASGASFERVFIDEVLGAFQL